MSKKFINRSLTIQDIHSQLLHVEYIFEATEKLIEQYIQDGTYLSPIESTIIENNLKKMHKQFNTMKINLS